MNSPTACNRHRSSDTASRRVRRTGGWCRRTLRFESLEARALLAASPLHIGADEGALDVAGLGGAEAEAQEQPVLMHSRAEQIVIEFVNQARADPLAEAEILGLDGLNEGLPSGTISPDPKPPLAPNPLLYDAALAHSIDMAERNYFDHVSPDGQGPGNRIAATGYSAQQWGENLAELVGGSSAKRQLFEYEVHDTLFLSPDHRETLLKASFREIGVGLADITSIFGSGLVATQKFARQAGDAFLTGVVFGHMGEGFLGRSQSLEGVTVSAEPAGGGPALTTVTGPSGAYSLQAPPGTYTLRASGGALDEPIEVTNVSLGSQNVKVDLVESLTIDPDPFEPNGSFQQAAVLEGTDIHLDALTLHTTDDEDYFRWTAPADGTLDVWLSSPQPGDLDLFLYNANRWQIASSESTSSEEHVTLEVQAGQSYYILVQDWEGMWNADYSLTLQLETVGLGIAPSQRAMTHVNEAVEIDLLAHEEIAEMAVDSLTVHIESSPQHGQVQIDPVTGRVYYTPPADFVGLDRFSYSVANDQGERSGAGSMAVTVLDLENKPWQNPVDPLDVNGDGFVAPLDALLIINELNARDSRPLPLPTPDGMFPLPYYDVRGDDHIAPLDALLVINFLNRQAAEGEALSISGQDVELSEWNMISVALPILGHDPLPLHVGRPSVGLGGSVGDRPQPGVGDRPQPGVGDRPQPGVGDRPRPGPQPVLLASLSVSERFHFSTRELQGERAAADVPAAHDVVLMAAGQELDRAFAGYSRDWAYARCWLRVTMAPENSEAAC